VGVSASGIVARVAELVLAVHSVAVLAPLAGALGAHFVDDRGRRADGPP
jgi:hypothetical protein